MKLYSVSVLLLLTFAAVSVFGQSPQPAKPELSGEWILEAHSVRDGKLVGPSPSYQLRLTISQDDPELKIKRTRVANGSEEIDELTFYTDGRGEKNAGIGFTTNPPSQVKVEVASKTKWHKNKLVVRGNFRQALAGRVQEVKQTDEWQLDEEGRLVQTTTLRFEDLDVQIPSTRPTTGITITPPPVKTKKIYRRVA